ncbi:unnamed protein product [Caenorhabditis auriculariae]|uniref:Pre-rRNA-processing protein TSR2 homolog n=1 Tax=Caenorhabditis auriculariae TaxID=2777116 RepID=A0A8S1H9S6_9PELO|nr:unnamed protein product [Caenorhabditis auriculariae]
MAQRTIEETVHAFVERVFSVWSGLQLAIDQSSAGSETREKYLWLVNVTSEHIISTRGLGAEDLEEWLATILYHDFDLILEDDSVYGTSYLLLEAYGYIKHNDESRLNQLIAGLPTPQQVSEANKSSRREGNDEDDVDMDAISSGDEEEEDQEDKPERTKLQHVTDSDGWTTIVRNLVRRFGSLKENEESRLWGRRSAVWQETEGMAELQTALGEASKQTHQLWEENKDLQGRFVNDLSELQRIQLAITQLENERRTDQLQHARHSLAEVQRRASSIYEMLTAKRADIVKKLNDGTNFVALLQNQLITERLFEWKNRQKLAQVGLVFDDRDATLDEIQIEFEFLAEQNWQLHMFTCWMLDLLRRGPQLNDNNAQTTAANMSTLMDQLTKLLFMLVSQSFVVSVQPEPVLKTQHKFVTEVRLLIGEKLGIRQHLVNTNVTVKIIAEEEAKQLSSTHVNHKDIKTVGTISNDFEKMTMDERNHMAAKFNNSKLTRIAHRKTSAKRRHDGLEMLVQHAGGDRSKVRSSLPHQHFPAGQPGQV